MRACGWGSTARDRSIWFPYCGHPHIESARRIYGAGRPSASFGYGRMKGWTDGGTTRPHVHPSASPCSTPVEPVPQNRRTNATRVRKSGGGSALLPRRTPLQSAGPAPSPRGNRTVKQVPTPFSLSTSIDPPSASTRRCTIESPSPLPSYSRRTPDDSCLNASKIWFWNASSMPTPVSSTSRTAVSGASRTRTSTRPSAGVNLIAFSIRLPTIRLRAPSFHCPSTDPSGRCVRIATGFSAAVGRNISAVSSTTAFRHTDSRFKVSTPASSFES